jgi:hypothetical protein
MGQRGEDELVGRSGNDRIHGGSHADLGRGGLGEDRCAAIEQRFSCEGS